MNPEIASLKEENSRLRDLVRQHEIDRDAKEYYERLLAEIGKSIGCGHIDDRLPSCVGDVIRDGNDAISILKTIVRRNGILPEGVHRIEDFLKSIGIITRHG